MVSFRSKITQKVLGHFYLHENAEMYINEMAGRFKLDSGNLTRKLEELEKEGLLKSRWQGAQRYYSLNPGFPLYQEYKRIIQKTVGFEETLRIALRDLAGIEQAVIFGSYAADQMDQKSDIDLLVIGRHSTVDLQKKIAQIQKTMNREINCISMTGPEFQARQKKDPLLKSIQTKANIRLL
jgi:predicted nucleotidyltransferase